MIPAISSAVHALGAQAAISPVAGSGTTAVTGAAHSGAASFGSQLENAIGSLDKSQQTATSAAKGLATGTVTDPTQAVTSVENASLAMDLASQIQNKLISAESTIFSTQM